MPIPLFETEIFDIGTIYKGSKLLIDFDDGSKGFINHKRIDVYFRHKKSGDVIQFAVTGKGHHYRKAVLEKKESAISQSEFLSEIARLTDKKQVDYIHGLILWRLINGT